MSDTVVYLEWADRGVVRVVVGAGYGHSRTVPVAAVPTVPGVRGALVATLHAAGPALALVAGRVAAEWDAPAYIQSDGGDLTPVAGRAAVTLHAWATGDPEGHPAGRVCPYADGADRRALADLIGLVFDPAWYQPALRPSDLADWRPSRLEARLGLTPRWDRRGSTLRSVVTAAWASPAHRAGNFFDGMYDDLTSAGAEPGAAERKVGRYFVRCLTAAWVDRGYRGCDPVFDRTLLFARRHIP